MNPNLPVPKVEAGHETEIMRDHFPPRTTAQVRN